MKRRQAVFDLNFNSWHWTQWTSTIAFIFFFINAITSKYVFIKVFNMRITLMVLLLIIGAGFNYGYILGMFVNQTKERILQYLLFPILTIPASLLAFFLLSRVFPVNINWIAYVRLAITYIILAINIYICFKKVSFEYTTFTEKELKIMGILE